MAPLKESEAGIEGEGESIREVKGAGLHYAPAGRHPAGPLRACRACPEEMGAWGFIPPRVSPNGPGGSSGAHFPPLLACPFARPDEPLLLERQEPVPWLRTRPRCPPGGRCCGWGIDALAPAAASGILKAGHLFDATHL